MNFRDSCLGWEWHTIDALLGVGELFSPLKNIVESGKLK